MSSAFKLLLGDNETSEWQDNHAGAKTTNLHFIPSHSFPNPLLIVVGNSTFTGIIICMVHIIFMIWYDMIHIYNVKYCLFIAGLFPVTQRQRVFSVLSDLYCTWCKQSTTLTCIHQRNSFFIHGFCRLESVNGNKTKTRILPPPLSLIDDWSLIELNPFSECDWKRIHPPSRKDRLVPAIAPSVFHLLFIAQEILPVHPFCLSVRPPI